MGARQNRRAVRVTSDAVAGGSRSSSTRCEVRWLRFPRSLKPLLTRPSTETRDSSSSGWPLLRVAASSESWSVRRSLRFASSGSRSREVVRQAASAAALGGARSNRGSRTAFPHRGRSAALAPGAGQSRVERARSRGLGRSRRRQCGFERDRRSALCRGLRCRNTSPSESDLRDRGSAERGRGRLRAGPRDRPRDSGGAPRHADGDVDSGPGCDVHDRVRGRSAPAGRSASRGRERFACLRPQSPRYACMSGLAASSTCSVLAGES